MTLQQQFGNIDIYVFDQLLRGNIRPGMAIFDAGCGGGRNLVYLMQHGYDISGCDQSAAAIRTVREMAAQLAPTLSRDNFQVAAIEDIPFASEIADVVLCNSVLHFARDDEHFYAMVSELWRILRPGGMLFCRLGSTIGMEFPHVRGHIFRVGDGQEWFLVNEAMLLEATAQLGAQLVDPLKTTVVQDHRCMTTWVLRKA